MKPIGFYDGNDSLRPSKLIGKRENYPKSVFTSLNATIVIDVHLNTFHGFQWNVCVYVMMSLIVGLLNRFIIERNESYNEETSIASPSVHIAVSLRNRHPINRPRYNSFHCWHSHIQSDLNAVLIAPFCRRTHRERFN